MRRLLLELPLVAVLTAAGAAHPAPQLGGFGNSPETQEAEEPVLADPGTRRAQLAPELEATRAALATARAAGSEGRIDVLAREVQLLERIEFLLGQEATVLEVRDNIGVEQADIERKRSAFENAGVPGGPPYSFLLLEDFLDRCDAEEDRLPSLEAGYSATLASLEQAREGLEGAERNRQQAKEEWEEADRPTEGNPITSDLRHAQLESRVAQEMVRLREAEKATIELRQRLHDERVELVHDQIERIEEDLRFDEDDLTRKLAEIAAFAGYISDGRGMIAAELPRLVERRLEVQRRLDAESGDQRLLQAISETLQIERSYRTRELHVLDRQLVYLDQLQETWRRRHAIFNDLADPSQVLDWGQDAREQLAELERDALIDETGVSDCRDHLSDVETRLAVDADGEAEMLELLRSQRRDCLALIEAYESDASVLAGTRRVLKRLSSELGQEAGGFSFNERMVLVGEWLDRVWNFTVWDVGDRPITVRKIVTGLFLLILGVWLSRRISAYLFQSLLRRFGLNEGVAAAIRSLVYYGLVLTFALFALQIVNIPLTIFTLAGGALAIGVGFGSQSIVNNFISGLILLAERPIRVGDLIEVGALFGNVINIGARSTTVRTGSNVDIIVPNSSFLESNVINWTLVDHSVRVHIVVGVAYGSPVREVAKLLVKSTEGHGKVLRSPEPFVLFTEFGDNALVFELHFWTHIRKLMDRRRIESDMRFRVDSLFRDAGITIAFPQRDVHVDSLSPVKVELVPAAPEPPEA